MVRLEFFSRCCAVLFTLLLISTVCDANIADAAGIDATVVFAERDGLLAVEAEHFFQQTKDDVRSFHLTTSASEQDFKGPDGDPPHVAGASGGAYLEILPDTRRTHDDRLIRGENFAPDAGQMAVLHYNVHITTPGRYYVWARAFSTGTEDNGLHVGIDGTWPESGQRLQWCTGKNTWRWESKQRTDRQHCGEPHKIFLDIKEPGDHVIQFAMREDGFEFDRWLMTTDRDFKRPADAGPATLLKSGTLPTALPLVAAADDNAPAKEKPQQKMARDKSAVAQPLQMPRHPDGDGSVAISGVLRQWHNITFTMNGPYAHELDNHPNPFTDYKMQVTFTHSDGATYSVPGYFAADGNAANTSAVSGTKWRAHFAPDQTGDWTYRIAFTTGTDAAIDNTGKSAPVKPFDLVQGKFHVDASDKSGRDLRAHGRLDYVGARYLQFAGSGQYFLKAGADAPETLLAFTDFDDTIARNPKKAPLKTWEPHLGDWREGDPTWGDQKGKGLIGAINYLSGKGCNAFSFLTYNAGGDGDNVWPFTTRDDKLHYDCSKLDQWGIVFEHGTQRGMYLHFKLQETENDDNRRGKKDGGSVRESLDGGDLARERKLYCRQLIARFGHNLALNWNIGEENTQSTAQQIAMIDYIAQTDPYDHPIVLHTFPDQQDKVYRPLLGDRSKLTGVSLQNSSLQTTHVQTAKWITESVKAGKPWVVAFDESGSAAHAQCPDLGYRGFDGHDHSGKPTHTQHEVRKQTLWGTLMAGGAGNEYYFGYKFDENDIVCQDWRSRDQSWDYCRIAIEFFHENKIPFWQMDNADALVGNPDHSNSKYCFAKPDSVYLVYLPDGGSSDLDLSSAGGSFEVRWFNPRQGGSLQKGSIESVSGGDSVSLGQPPAEKEQDWLAIIRRKP